MKAALPYVIGALLGATLLWGVESRNRSKAHDEVVEATALADQALDSAAALRERLDVAIAEDGMLTAAMEDSVAAWAARGAATLVRLAEARRASGRIATDLRATMDSAQVVMLDSLETSHADEVATLELRDLDRLAEIAARDAEDVRVRALLFASERDSELLRGSVAQLEIALDAQARIIASQQRTGTLLKVGGIAGWSMALAQFAGLIGG